MEQNFRKTYLLVGCALAAIAVPGYAQTTPGEPDTDDNVQTSNIIVVTAQNRSENVQDVPIAIDVVGQDALDAYA